MAHPVERLVSNMHQNVFAVTGLPEEDVAMLFAFYSRSPGDLRGTLRRLLDDGDLVVPPPSGDAPDVLAASDRAQAFHRKWTVSYGHGCYDGATEVLTEHGWMSWPALAALSSPPRLATLRPEDDVVEFLQPVKLIVAPYEGQMYRVRSGYVDLLVTPNHKMWVCPTTTRAGRRKDAYRLIEARELGLTSSAYQMDAVWKGESADAITQDEHSFRADPMMALMGFFIGDGHHDPRYHDAVTFHLKKERKIRFLTEVCAEGQFELRRHLGNKFYVTAPGLGDLLSKCYSENGEKQIPRSVLGLSSELLERLMEGMMASDGHVDRHDSWLYSTTSTVLRDQCYELALRVGCSAYARTDTERGENRDPLHVVHFNRSRVRPVVNKLAGDNQVSWESYVGTVYCAEMPRNHTLFVRRNMRAVWCGNSVSEHAVGHFATERVSILAAKAMEDRRLGVAFTEKSTRFVRMDRGALVREIGLRPQHQKLYEDVAFRLLDAYDEMTGELLAEMERRHPETEKAVREARVFDLLRGLLPAGVATNVGMSGNGRAMAHMIRSLRETNLPEHRGIASLLQAEGLLVMPTLLRHLDPSGHRADTVARVSVAYARVLSERLGVVVPPSALVPPRGVVAGHSVTLLDAHGIDVESLAIAILREIRDPAAFHPHGMRLSEPAALAIVSAYLSDRGEWDTVGRALEHTLLRFQITCDYGAWRDLQRHRILAATTPELTAEADFACPEGLREFGMYDRFCRAIEESARGYYTFSRVAGREFGQYVVPLARQVTWVTTMNLREFFHLAELRSGSGGHPSYRAVAIDAADAIIGVCPFLEPFLRVDRKGYVWAREPKAKGKVTA